MHLATTAITVCNFGGEVRTTTNYSNYRVQFWGKVRTAKWIWDSSKFYSIKPKLDIELFVDFCVFISFCMMWSQYAEANF